MLLLMTASLPTALKWRHANLGRLVVPRDCARVAETHAYGIPWAADNGAFSGFDEQKWSRMLGRIAGAGGCLFVTAPDVVGNADETAKLWHEHRRTITAAGLPAAWVAQDGAGPDDIPGDAEAVFIGGSTAYKLGERAAAIVATARDLGLWVHMGRVNTIARMRYAASIGCDSVDGTRFSLWRDQSLPGALALLSAGEQMRMTA